MLTQMDFLEMSCLFLLSIIWHCLCYGTALSEAPRHTLNYTRASSLILLISFALLLQL